MGSPEYEIDLHLMMQINATHIALISEEEDEIWKIGIKKKIKPFRGLPCRGGQLFDIQEMLEIYG